jgi:hypothetical protein
MKADNSNTQISEMSTEHEFFNFIMAEIQKITLLEKSDSDWPPINPKAELVLRSIADFPDPIDWNVPTRNIRIDKNKLRKFLQSKYSSRFASKLVALFDFSLQLDYKMFFKQVLDFVICQQKNPQEIVLNAKHFAFHLYDMNCDGYVDQVDLFSIFKDQKND